MIEKKLILLGPKFSRNEVGGIVTLFHELCSVMPFFKVDYKIFDINGSNYKFKIMMFVNFFLYVLLKKNKNIHISLHGTANHYLYFSLFLIFFKKIFNIEYSTRKFAGNFYEIFNSSSRFNKWLLILLLKNSKVNFFETRYLVKKFKIYNEQTFFFPNVRRKSNFIKNRVFNPKIPKIGFISQIFLEKGIEDFIKLAKLFPNYHFTIAGPNICNYNFDSINYLKNVEYIGGVAYDDIPEFFNSIDLLVFPSFYKGEGYPGVIIEAFASGTPVVASKWLSIPELFSNDNLLFEPRNIMELKKSIDYVFLNYKDVCNEITSMFEVFDSMSCTKMYLEKIKI